MKQFLLVFLGGGFGSMARFGIGKLLNTQVYPYGTFSVNMIGSFLIGCVLGYFLKENTASQNLMLFLTVGFCGGFTTFSAFAYENLAMLKQGNYSIFLLYMITSIFLGILAVGLGLWTSKIFDF